MSLTGILQVDETYLGIYAKNLRKNKVKTFEDREKYVSYKKKIGINKVLKKAETWTRYAPGVCGG
jgi:hypothetical protein